MKALLLITHMLNGVRRYACVELKHACDIDMHQLERAASKVKKNFTNLTYI